MESGTALCAITCRGPGFRCASSGLRGLIRATGLDMGEPVKIRYLAEQMILLSGHQPGRDIEIRHTGLRPGEKLFEEL